MYTQEQIQRVLDEYKKHHSIQKTIVTCGYPSRTTLYSWLALLEKGKPINPSKQYSHTSHKPPFESSDRMKALTRCFRDGESVSVVAADIGVNRTIIYHWRKKYLKEGEIGLMNRKRDAIPKGSLEPQQDHASTQEIEDLKAQIKRLQMQVDVLSEAMNILKKGQGVNPLTLKNKEKFLLVHAFRNKYDLKELRQMLGFSKSSYYYHLALQKRETIPDPLEETITEIYHESKQTYGYRRIWMVLKQQGIRRSEKIIRGIQKKLGLQPLQKRRRSYSSYGGEISPAPENLLRRDFRADASNQKWVSDITEFAIPAGKVYLSPIVDCFDGLVVSWSISEKPNALLTNSMLENACKTLTRGETPILHTDRGAHYRWDSWIELTKKYGVIRSMSKKACSPDNAACEAFFGRFKNELFYQKNFQNTSIEAFMEYLHNALHWYNEKRLKTSFGCSIVEHRNKLLEQI